MSEIPSESSKYGDVWGGAGSVLGRLAEGGERFRDALAHGFFSQLTAYVDPAQNARIVDWELACLAERHGFALADLPPGLDELSIVSEQSVVVRSGRRVSPDLLRHVYCWKIVEAHLAAVPHPRILEIGSGYGAFARVVKAFRPDARLVLADIPESLAFARTYLSQAFPDCTIAMASDGVLPEADIVLVPVGAADLLEGGHFDLAVNIWSFGEMTNAFVRYWLDLVQVRSRTDRLFLINSFLTPVSPDSVQRAEHGDWLCNIDDGWRLEWREIQPHIHRNPWVRNFPTGIGLVASRTDGPDERAAAADQARAAALAVRDEDWALLAATERGGIPDVRGDGVRNRMDYLGFVLIDPSLEQSLFALWDDFRLNGEVVSGKLLVVLISLIARSNPRQRISKEEVFLLRRLPASPLHNEYDRFVTASEGAAIHHDGALVAVDDAWAIARRCAATDPDKAEAILLQICTVAPRHGMAWQSLAALKRCQGDKTLAAALDACGQWVVSAEPNSLQAAWQALQRGESKVAGAAFTRLLRAGSDPYMCLSGLALIQARASRWPLADALFAAAAALSPVARS